MIYLLPTRSARKYRGKYPTRINSWSYSRSPSQMIVATHLDMKRPVHMELNNGSRYIADMCDLVGDVRLAVEFDDAMLPRTEQLELSQERYDAMLADIRAHREAVS
jgi:hypothetical protein